MWLQACHGESASHLILVQPVQDLVDEADDYIKVVDRNKESILEAITSCLEQPLCNMLQERLHLYSKDSFIPDDVDALYKKRLYHNNTQASRRLEDVPFGVNFCTV